MGDVAAKPLCDLPRVAQQRGLRQLRETVWPATAAVPYLRHQPARTIGPVRCVPAKPAAADLRDGCGGLHLPLGQFGA